MSTIKLLHTADWHLGKRLDHISRLPEQEEVLEEICEIADREAVDAVLVAGDLFDHANPSIEAIDLLYRTLKRLASDGRRAVIGIAGNHDAPDRIAAPDPLARECGIVLAGYPHSLIRPFALASGLSILQSAPGFVELQLPGKKFPLRLLLTPYANGLRLKKFLGHENTEEELRNALQGHWQEIAETYCDEYGVNLLMAHLFFMRKGGPKPEEPEDEKTILSIGGAQEIFTENLPKQIQYVALGHLHRPQLIGESPAPVVYSGSPLAYSMSEAGQQKSVTLIEVEPGKAASFRHLPLHKGKQLVRISFDSADEAVKWLTENPNTLVELTLVSDHFLSAQDRKRIFSAHPGIVALIPRITNPELLASQAAQIDLSRDIQELFLDYFRHKQGQEPNEEVMDLFREILAEEEEE